MVINGFEGEVKIKVELNSAAGISYKHEWKSAEQRAKAPSRECAFAVGE
jgi:hypothetical protein